jgi:16S rRNA (cytosine1402-N4)-methyltransferase
MRHITVLQQEAVSLLNLSNDSVVVDCTLGSGGHAREILKILKKKGTYIGIDVDKTALQSNSDLQEQAQAKVILVEDNFRNLGNILDTLGISAVDAVLADLGWRMEQFEGEAGELRGFSFRREEPLAMTYGSSGAYPFTAYDIVNTWQEEDIANVIYAYGEERFSRRIARKIVEARGKSPIGTSTELAALVEEAVPRVYAKKRIHPATKTFQALRIAVNDEFDALRELLLSGFEHLVPGGRMAIITFHSLEDRIVKETFRTFTRDQKGVLVHKKPIEASVEELQANPRARSAKLRTIEKI